MLRARLLRRDARAVSCIGSRRQLSTSANPVETVSSAARPRDLRSKWRRAAVAGASLGLLLSLSPSSSADDSASPLRRQWLVLRSGWVLSSSFAVYTGVHRDLLGRGAEGEDEETARAALRIQWWDAIQRSQQASASDAIGSSILQDRMVCVILHLMAPSRETDESPTDLARGDRDQLRQLLVDRGVVALLVDYIALFRPTDPLLLKKVVRCLELALEKSIRPEIYTESASQPSLMTLGIALGHLMDMETLRDEDLSRLSQRLLQVGWISREPLETKYSQGSFTTPHRLDMDFARAVQGYVRLLAPEMPRAAKEFALDALASMLNTVVRLPECVTTRQLDALLSLRCAKLLAAIPRSDDQLQLGAAALLTSLIQLSQISVVPVHDDVYKKWMQQVQAGARDSSNNGIQLASARCLRMLSGHPRTRHLVRDSRESMEALYALARRLHETQLQMPQQQQGKKSKKNQVKVPNLYDHVEQALIQKHLSKTFLNVCTSFKSGGTAILETMSPEVFHTKRRLPMSYVFKATHDVMDLPVYGADEYEASTEFGWVDILTRWTGSSDRDIRRNAIQSLVHLVEQDSDTEAGVEKQRHLLQAWLASTLQHVRNVTGGEEILAIKQVEEIARISDEFTPGNEKVLFNPAMVDAGASALAVLAEQHYDELIHFGVVQLVSLLATNCPSDARFDFATQSARVIANLVAACAKTLEETNCGTVGHELPTAAELKSSSATVEPFSFRHPLWRTFFSEVFDVGQMLETTSSGLALLHTFRTWRERDDPYQRSQLFRALNNMAAYRQVARAGSTSMPIYAEGVHPIVPHGAEAEDLLASTSDSDVDVVFVHGLRGDAFGTWRTDMGDAIDSRTDIWPDILLQQDMRSLGIRARVLSLGYEAGMVSWSSPWPSLTLQERAKLMLSALNDAQVGRSGGSDSTPRPVVFVTHSMGGILVKKMLLLSQSDREGQVANDAVATRTLAECTTGVVFLAVPHFGSDLARGAGSEAVRSLLQTHPAIQDLCASHDRRLENLNESFAQLHIDCLSIGEQKAAPLGFGLSAMVVRPESANPGIGDFFILPNSDHMTICKAKTHDELMYQSVLDYVLDHTDRKRSLQ